MAVDVIRVDRVEPHGRRVVQHRSIVDSVNFDRDRRTALTAITVCNRVVEVVVSDLARSERLRVIRMRRVVGEVAIAVDVHGRTVFTDRVVANDRQRIVLAGRVGVVVEQSAGIENMVLVNRCEVIVPFLIVHRERVVVSRRGDVVDLDDECFRRCVSGRVGRGERCLIAAVIQRREVD